MTMTTTKTLTTTELGSFDITSGEARISDPCYKVDEWCAGTIDKVKYGKWDAYVIKSDEGEWGNRCAVLIAVHEDYTIDADDPNFETADIDVGVDSGQAGIFDLSFFKDDESVADTKRIASDAGRICEDEPWYSICCDRTLSEVGAGVIPFGCVSSSGYGDGSYECSVVRDTHSPECEVVAIKIDFGVIGNEDDED